MVSRQRFTIEAPILFFSFILSVLGHCYRVEISSTFNTASHRTRHCRWCHKLAKCEERSHNANKQASIVNPARKEFMDQQTTFHSTSKHKLLISLHCVPSDGLISLQTLLINLLFIWMERSLFEYFLKREFFTCDVVVAPIRWTRNLFMA